MAAIADAFGVGRFAVMGASGGGPHALACAALLGDRVTGAVAIAGIAPYTEDFDWFAGMRAPGGLRAARGGRAARARFAETDEFDPESFTAADWAALSGAWQSLGSDAMAAGEAGPDGLIDDDVAFASPWGFEVARGRGPGPARAGRGGPRRSAGARRVDGAPRAAPRAVAAPARRPRLGPRRRARSRWTGSASTATATRG